MKIVCFIKLVSILQCNNAKFISPKSISLVIKTILTKIDLTSFLTEKHVQVYLSVPEYHFSQFSKLQILLFTSIYKKVSFVKF